MLMHAGHDEKSDEIKKHTSIRQNNSPLKITPMLEIKQTKMRSAKSN